MRGMGRLERVYKIGKLLKERKAMPFAALRSALGVSAPILERDLGYMRERFNAPIEYDREANGYRFGAPRAMRRRRPARRAAPVSPATPLLAVPLAHPPSQLDWLIS